MNPKILERIGLSDSEIKVYFALIKLGLSSTGPIIAEAKINHSKIYLILKKLQDKGLVSFVVKNNVKYFQASDPDNLLKYVKSKKEEIEDQEKEIERLIPDLKMQRNSLNENQEATVYTGYGGVKAALSFLLENMNKGEEYYVITVYEEATEKELQLLFRNYHNKRIEKEIKVKLLTMKKFEEETRKKFPNYKLSERRFIDFELPTGVFIFKEYVMNFIWGENPTIFLLKSEQNANRYRKFFEDFWRKAK